jgi:hypothetical protein
MSLANLIVYSVKGLQLLFRRVLAYLDKVALVCCISHIIQAALNGLVCLSNLYHIMDLKLDEHCPAN